MRYLADRRPLRVQLARHGQRHAEARSAEPGYRAQPVSRRRKTAFDPLEFWYEDGSRSGEDNLHVVFDWDRRVATVSSAEARRELALPETRARPRHPASCADARPRSDGCACAPYTLADEDSVVEYEYNDNGTATMPTGVGPVATRVLTQQRAGSSRATWLWVAPELRFLPVRIEQRRDGEVQTAFVLISVDGLARPVAISARLRSAAA